MTESRAGKQPNDREKETGRRIPIERLPPLLFLGLLIVGTVGYLALRNLGIRYAFAHVGGLGIVGLVSCLAGTIARRKGYSYRKALLLGILFPAVLGIIGAFLIPPPGEGGRPTACGGTPSLGAAVLVVMFYLFAKRKDSRKQIASSGV